MSLRALYLTDLAAGRDVSAHDGRPRDPGAPRVAGPPLQVRWCAACARYHSKLPRGWTPCSPTTRLETPDPKEPRP